MWRLFFIVRDYAGIFQVARGSPKRKHAEAEQNNTFQMLLLTHTLNVPTTNVYNVLAADAISFP